MEQTVRPTQPLTSPEAPHYLAYAAVSPPASAARDALARYVDGVATRGVRELPEWLAARERLRENLATLLDVEAPALALTSSTTHAIQAVAMSLRLGPGDEILCFGGEFPANVHSWEARGRALGLATRRPHLDTVFGTAGRDALAPDACAARLEALLAGRRVRLVAISAVQFQTGRQMPLRALSEVCHRHGALLFADCIQAAGCVPLSLAEAGVDFAAGGGHKWLLGTDGAGWLFVAPGREAALAPTMTGWLSVRDPVGFLGRPDALDHDAPLVSAPRCFEAGSSSSAAVIALDAAVAAILKVGVARIFAATQRFHDAIEAPLAALGFTSERSRTPDGRSGILALRPPADVSLAPLQARLAERGVIVTIPDGRLRIAPHLDADPSRADEVTAAIEAALEA
jgi:cysteine desulfurase/selenocysteine lyase